MQLLCYDDLGSIIQLINRETGLNFCLVTYKPILSATLLQYNVMPKLFYEKTENTFELGYLLSWESFHYKSGAAAEWFSNTDLSFDGLYKEETEKLKNTITKIINLYTRM